MLHKIETITREDLAFKSQRTDIYTHSLHTYPAKFIPQIACELILQFTKPGDFIGDVFAGSGTTNVEAMRLGRHSLALDVNPVASLITRAKTSYVDPIELEKSIIHCIHSATLSSASENLSSYSTQKILEGKNITRLKYWFSEKNIVELAYLLSEIEKETDQNTRDILLLIFSSCLKPSSNWLDWSIKPQRDCRPEAPNDPKLKDSSIRYRRQVPSALSVFEKKGNETLKKYKDFASVLLKNEQFKPKVVCQDTLKYDFDSIMFDAIITSPPYLTSYEYADLHQLTALWLFNAQSAGELKKLGFIGSKTDDSQRFTDSSMIVNSPTLMSLESVIESRSAKKQIDHFFLAIERVFIKCRNALKIGGKLCVVIGDSRFKGYEIQNHKIFIEILEGIGFKIENIWERPISNKRLTSLRDASSGRILPKTFDGHKNAIRIYPTEFILVFSKCQ